MVRYCLFIVFAVLVWVSQSFGSVTLTDSDVTLAAEIFAGSYGETEKHFGVYFVKPYFEKLVLAIEKNVLDGNPDLFGDAVTIFDKEFGTAVGLGIPFVSYSHHAIHALWFVWAHRLNNMSSVVYVGMRESGEAGESRSVVDDIDEALIALIILRNLHLKYSPVDLYDDGFALMQTPRLLKVRSDLPEDALGLFGGLQYAGEVLTRFLHFSYTDDFSVPDPFSTFCEKRPVVISHHGDRVSMHRAIPLDSYSANEVGGTSEGLLVLLRAVQFFTVLNFVFAIVSLSLFVFFVGYTAHKISTLGSKGSA